MALSYVLLIIVNNETNFLPYYDQILHMYKTCIPVPIVCALHTRLVINLIYATD